VLGTELEQNETLAVIQLSSTGTAASYTVGGLGTELEQNETLAVTQLSGTGTAVGVLGTELEQNKTLAVTQLSSTGTAVSYTGKIKICKRCHTLLFIGTLVMRLFS